MNHNIRYELRDPDNLEVSIEISKTLFGNGVGGGAVGPDGVGAAGLNVFMEVFNIEKGLWWYSGNGMAINEWTRVSPDPGAAPGTHNHISKYQWPLTNPLTGLGFPWEQPFEGLYTSHSIPNGGLTNGIRKLREGSGWDPREDFPADAHFWDQTWVENNLGAGAWNDPWNGWTGRSGFFVRITALNGVGQSIIEFLHLMPLAISHRSIAPGAIHAGDATFGISPALAGGAIHAGNSLLNLYPAIAGGAIHPGNGNPGTEAIAPGAIHAGDLPNGIVPAIAPNAIHAGLGGVPGAIATDAITHLQIAHNAIGAPQLANNAITADKIAHWAITDDKIANNAITSNQIGPNAIGASEIANNAITADKIATDAITHLQIAHNAIGAPQLANNAITADKIAHWAITADKIANNAITSNQIGPNAIGASEIANNAITADKIADYAIHNKALAAGAIHKDGGLNGEPAIEASAIHDEALAENAINEKAIQVDSVTYEEISDSAIREIVNGIWNASILSPIDNSGDLSGSNMHIADIGTMGHAMLVDYIAKNMIHVSSADFGNGPKTMFTPMHITSTNDPSGTKFYSDFLSATPLTSWEIKSYIDRPAVLFRGLRLPTGALGGKVPVRLMQYSMSPGLPFPLGDGWEGGTFKVFDHNNNEVASETLEVLGAGSDIILLDADDVNLYTYEFSYVGVPPDTDGFSLRRLDTNELLTSGIVGPGVPAQPNPIVGTFALPAEAPTSSENVQHLVRITDVAEDAHGQFFKIQLVNEEGGPIPEGIRATNVEAPGFINHNYPGDILIIKSETDATMHEVAHEVWEETVLDHATPDTFGMLNRVVAGLSQFNHQITDSTYDESGRLLACRLVVYSSSEDAKNGVNPLTTIEVKSSYDEKQNMTTFVAAEESQE